MNNLNEEQISNSLHKESFKQEFHLYKMGMTKNHSFSDYNKLQIYKNKNPEEQLSEWKTQDKIQSKKNTQRRKSFLPQMRKTKRSIQQLQKKVKIMNEINESKELDKNSSQVDFKSYRYTFLKQFVNYTPTQKKSPNNFQLSKIDLKLRFPSKYSKLQNMQIKQHSFYLQKTSRRGLIPSIKKLISPPVTSRYVKNSCQEGNNDSIYTPKQYKQSDLSWIQKPIQDQFLKKSIQDRQKKVKLARIQKRLPINFLNKYKKKSKSKEGQEQLTRLKECLILNKNQ